VGLDFRGYQSGGVYDLDAPADADRAAYVDETNMEAVNFRKISDDPATGVGGQAGVDRMYEQLGWTGVTELTNNLNPVFLDGLNPTKPRPILYYKANKRGDYIHQIYDFQDNYLINGNSALGGAGNMTSVHWTDPAGDNYPDGLTEVWTDFQYFVWNVSTGTTNEPLRSASARPYNPDTFILMTAGRDGEFGTADDICNFERKQ